MTAKLKSRYYRFRSLLGIGAMLATTLVFAGAVQLAAPKIPVSQSWDSSDMQRLLDYHQQASGTVPLMQPIQQQLIMRHFLINTSQAPGDQFEER